MTFLTPSALWLLALLPVVVALHYLRARRRRYDVPALFLWQRAQTAVARRRRFSPTWLLAAQLLFVALAAVALARPVLTGGERPDRVIVVDASASMAAQVGDTQRLELAKREARELLTGAGRVALVRAGLDARLVAPVDAEPSQLAAALAELQAGDAAGDLLRALELANAVLPGAEVHVFTDHDAMLGAAQVHRVGTPAENVGISAFEIGVGQAFVAVVAAGARPAQVELELRQGDTQLARGTVLVPTTGTGSITFPLEGVSGVVEARLTPPPGDALALDDVAYAGSRALQVVSNDAYEPLLRALMAVPLTTVGVAPDAAFRPTADLKVVSRAGADGLPPGNYLLFPPRAAEPEYQLISDWNRADSLMRFVDLRDVVVGLDPERQAWEETEGWQVLARTADLTPVVRARQDASGLTLQLAFHPAQSDVVLRTAFPALVANLMGQLDTTVRVRLGEPLPGGTEPVLEPGPHRALSGVGEGAGGTDLVYASLLAPEESRLPERSGVAQGAQGAPGMATPANTPASTPASATAAASEGAEGSEPVLTLLERSGAPTGAALVLLTLALLALLAEWLLFSGGKARRLVG